MLGRDLQYTATDSAARQDSIGELTLDVGHVMIVPLRLGDERVLVAMPRDALSGSGHIFPHSPSGRVATAEVQLTSGDYVFVFPWFWKPTSSSKRTFMC